MLSERFAERIPEGLERLIKLPRFEAGSSLAGGSLFRRFRQIKAAMPDRRRTALMHIEMASQSCAAPFGPVKQRHGVVDGLRRLQTRIVADCVEHQLPKLIVPTLALEKSGKRAEITTRIGRESSLVHHEIE